MRGQPKEFYSTGDVARFMQVDPSTIFRAIEKGQLDAATTPGGHYRIHRAQLEEFLRKNNIPLDVLEPPTWRVLIVEDNPAELRFFQRSLGREADMKLKATHSGYEAGFLTKAFRPDLILLDIRLKEVDGRDIVRLVRSDPELKGVRIVAISSIRDPREIQELKALGVDAFIPKPVKPAELRTKLRGLLE